MGEAARSVFALYHGVELRVHFLPFIHPVDTFLGADKIVFARFERLAGSMFDIGRPDLDFRKMAEAHGVPAARATTADELCAELDRAYRGPGPHLIEAMFRP